ncbi:MAG: transglycosylase SLT domain-containing protein [Bacteroidaceae bacterium]|nr:transglycosylase SLT domain-containing protein [Bacteroidaceae bacterium]
MKKFMLTCLMTWTVAFTLSAATVDLEKKWAAVIRAIAQVESEGNPKMVSKCGRYVGYLQISKILVRECNQILGKQVYTYDDRYDKQKSIDMFIVFQEHFNKEGNTEKAIRLWNSGDLNCMKHKRPTEGYYRRVMAKFTAQAQAE